MLEHMLFALLTAAVSADDCTCGALEKEVRALRSEMDFRHVSREPDLQVGTLLAAAEVRRRGAVPHPVANDVLIVTHPAALIAVEVRVEWFTDGTRRSHEGAGKEVAPHRSDLGDLDRPRGTVVLVLKIGVVLAPAG